MEFRFRFAQMPSLRLWEWVMVDATIEVGYIFHSHSTATLCGCCQLSVMDPPNGAPKELAELPDPSVSSNPFSADYFYLAKLTRAYMTWVAT